MNPRHLSDRVEGSSPQPRCLTFETRERHSFTHEPWRWIVTWTYSIADANCSDRDLISSLLLDDHFAYSFIVPEPHPMIGDSKVHGPYKIPDLGPDSFSEITVRDAEQLLHSFLSKAQPPATGNDIGLSSVLDNLSSASCVMRLETLPDARHELAFMLGDFTDLLVIDRQSQRVVEVVMGYD